MDRGLEGAKVSLHGPDPKHPGKQHLRYDVESDPKKIAQAKRAGGRWLTEPGPIYFSGRQVRHDAGHVVRYCAERDAFVGDAPPAGGSRFPKEKATGRVIPPVPKEGRVTYIDFYLSFGDPYWPDEARIRATQSGVGPITNASGMHLTMVVRDEPVRPELNPCEDFRGNVAPQDCLRGLIAAVDDKGVLWLSERLIPIATVDAQPKP